MAEGQELAYREHRPLPQLRERVQCLWELRGPGGDPTPQLIVPDGCMEIVLNFGRAFEHIVAAGRARQQPRTLVVGELRRPVTTRPTGRVDLLGVRLRPGAARFFLDGPAHEIVDDIFDEAPLGRPLVHDLRRLHDAEPRDRTDLLQVALLNQLKTRTRGHALVCSAARELVAREGCVEIERLAGVLGVTRRHLERRFVEEVGIAPKALASVLRFRRVLRAIDEQSKDWAGVAIDCGYYDQSHLIRDFKRFTGRTPSTYLREDHPLTVLFDGSTDPSP